MSKDTEVSIGNLNTMQVSHQWANRPNEERWTSLYDFHNYNMDVYHSSQTKTFALKELSARPVDGDETGKALEIVGPSGKGASVSNWAFNQLVGNRLESYPSMVSKMPAKLASDVINWRIGEVPDERLGILINRVTENGLVTVDTAAKQSLLIRAVTSEGYGRIWNYQVTLPLVDRFGDALTGDWTVPGIRGKALTEVTKENTTIFGSDKDMHVMLADEKNKLIIPNRRNGQSGELSRGFIVSNSEVGGGTLYVAFFTYDYLCGNRIIWGLEDSFEIRLRHSKTAPDRWLDEIAPAIENYGKVKASKFEDRLLLAQATKVNDKVMTVKGEGKTYLVPETLESSLKKTLPQVTQKLIVGIAKAFDDEENRPMETVWDEVTAITAYAKSIPYTSERIPVERAGGKLLELVAN